MVGCADDPHSIQSTCSRDNPGSWQIFVAVSATVVWTAVRIFLTVARLGSFAEAARQLRLSPTRSIARLEDQLGLMLLTRTTRSLRLTDCGKILLASGPQILTDKGRGGLACSGEADLRHPVKGDQFVLATLVS
jgi:hypothetical protein